MESTDLKKRVKQAGDRAAGSLQAERNEGGWWEGELASSALSTAVAVLALGEFEQSRRALREAPGNDTLDGCGKNIDLILGGLRWLAATQLGDGGWGDTTKSRANVATTLLGWAAFGLGMRILRGAGALAAPPEQMPKAEDFEKVVARVEGWIQRAAGGLEAGALKAALAGRYGKDRTFAVPILMACAVGGRLGSAPGCWREVPALPFELAAFPRRWFAALRLPVVSYALPALIAIGQVRHFHAPGWGPWAWVRRKVVGRTRRLLREIQPVGGGFLEATPLTGFVTMALCSAGEGAGEVVREAVDFLTRSVRKDGSWPIDSNLATWGTTLAVKALGGDLPDASRAPVRRWLLGQQYKTRHDYCMSAPGGWAWTDLPGGVPDADDTSGALLALQHLPQTGEKVDVASVEAGVRWLIGLQNGDGGIPTFCKGWGALPFDRSAPDLTAHALAAWQAWRGEISLNLRGPMRRAVAWLEKTQGPDGTWLPLWFGNEHEADEANPVYGTAVVLKYLCRLPLDEFPGLVQVERKAAGFLIGVQGPDGSWSGGPGGGPGSIEETGAALEALCAYEARPGISVDGHVLARGAEALLAQTGDGTIFPPAPIGLYFARLWYWEKLYPMISAVAAFRALAARGPQG